MAFADPDISGSRIRLRRSLTPGETPSAGAMRPGEVAVNSADGKIFVGKRDGTAQEVGGGAAKVVALTYSATVTTDAAAGDIFDLTLTGNVTLANPANPTDGKTIRWRIRQDGTGSRTVTLGNKFVIPSSATSPLPFSTAANKMDVLAATYHAGRDKWDIVSMVPGY